MGTLTLALDAEEERVVGDAGLHRRGELSPEDEERGEAAEGEERPTLRAIEAEEVVEREIENQPNQDAKCDGAEAIDHDPVANSPPQSGQRIAEGLFGFSRDVGQGCL